MWFNEACIYQIYPLGLCGAPAENDGIREHRILRVLDWACLLYTSDAADE